MKCFLFTSLTLTTLPLLSAHRYVWITVFNNNPVWKISERTNISIEFSGPNLRCHVSHKGEKWNSGKKRCKLWTTILDRSLVFQYLLSSSAQWGLSEFGSEVCSVWLSCLIKSRHKKVLEQVGQSPSTGIRNESSLLVWRNLLARQTKWAFIGQLLLMQEMLSLTSWKKMKRGKRLLGEEKEKNFTTQLCSIENQQKLVSFLIFFLFINWIMSSVNSTRFLFRCLKWGFVFSIAQKNSFLLPPHLTAWSGKLVYKQAPGSWWNTTNLAQSTVNNLRSAEQESPAWRFVPNLLHSSWALYTLIFLEHSTHL